MAPDTDTDTLTRMRTILIAMGGRQIDAIALAGELGIDDAAQFAEAIALAHAQGLILESMRPPGLLCLALTPAGVAWVREHLD